MYKHEWRKHEKALYFPKSTPQIIDIPSFKFISISGAGNPNEPAFSDCVSTLYSVAYPIKMMLKKSDTKPKGYSDYTIYPLEGLWSLNDEAARNFDGTVNLDDLVYDVMIRQPEFITEAYFQEILDQVKQKKPNKMLERVKLASITDGKCIQMMHIGSFENETESFQKMDIFAKENNLQRASGIHREIYISDFRKVSEEKLKTVLRFEVKS